jgi:hypothetical protein
MTTEQQLEALRVQLSSLAVDLKQLLVAKPTAPAPAVDSRKYDAYVGKLTALEHKLEAMEGAFRRLKGQGPAYHGSKEDAFRAKQREASFQHLVDKVDAEMKLCLDLLAELCAPNHAQQVKRVVDVAKKLDEFLKMLHTMPNFKTTVGHDSPNLVAPTGPSSPEVLFLPFVVAAIVLLRGLRGATGKGAGGK